MDLAVNMLFHLLRTLLNGDIYRVIKTFDNYWICPFHQGIIMDWYLTYLLRIGVLLMFLLDWYHVFFRIEFLRDWSFLPLGEMYHMN